MKKILCVMMALAIVGCADSGSSKKTGSDVEQGKISIDTSKCQGSVPAGLELWSNKWEQGSEDSKGEMVLIIDVPSKNSKIANLGLRCTDKDGVVMTGVTPAEIVFDNNSLGFPKETKIEALSKDMSKGCSMQLGTLKANYKFQGPCLLIEGAGGGSLLLVPVAR